jgi:thiol-disulfide isomerase/thioredoxin
MRRGAALSGLTSTFPMTLALSLLLTLALGTAALAQGPILSFTVSPEPVVIALGGWSEARLTVENRSIREADDIAVSWIEPDAFSLANDPEPIKILHPFETGSIPFAVAASNDAVEGANTGTLEIIYTYCIGEVCYQIVEEIDVGLLVEPPIVPPENGGSSPIVAQSTWDSRPLPWPWIGFGLGTLFVGGLLASSRRRDRKHVAVLGLCLVVVGGLAYGVVRKQHEQAQGLGAVLCLSCVGIEEAGSAEAQLSPAAITALRALDEDIELTVFYAEWCDSCPFAEAMVERMSEATDRIDYRFVDVEVEPDLAKRHGIIRAGRTVVPAITRSGSNEVLFGVEDLEKRLLEMLEVHR